MNSRVREARYIYADVTGNNNKFWNIEERSDASCSLQWGRVGSNGQIQVKSFDSTQRAASFFDLKCREKESKGYYRLKVLNGSGVVVKAAPGQEVAALAASQIETDSPQTMALVKRLAEANVHNILSSTQLVYDTSRGTFSTPLGIITQEAIDEARTTLQQMSGYVAQQNFSDQVYIKLLNHYLRLVPQKVGRKLDPAALYPNIEGIRKQGEILDSLEASLHLAVDKPDDAPFVPALKLFEARLKQVEDRKLIKRIEKFYQRTKQSQHACYQLDVAMVYEVEIKAMKQDFESHGRIVGNVMELWHGTRVSNLLSILKNGFMIPPANASHCTGRMFGNGVYFSDQSTKSLNYSFGYWGGTQDQNCFMLLNDVAMGKYYVPETWNTSLFPKGYDSTFAKANQSGVANNEMIVYDTRQINPKYLVEFSPKGK